MRKAAAIALVTGTALSLAACSKTENADVGNAAVAEENVGDAGAAAGDDFGNGGDLSAGNAGEALNASEPALGNSGDPALGNAGDPALGNAGNAAD